MWSSGPVEISYTRNFSDTTGARGAVIRRESSLEEKKKSSSLTDDRLGSRARPRRCSVGATCGGIYLVSCIWSCVRYGIREKAGVHMAPRAPCECAPGWAPFTMQLGLRHSGTRRRGSVLGRGGSGPASCIFPIFLSFFFFFFWKVLKQQSTLHLVPLHLHPSLSLSLSFSLLSFPFLPPSPFFSSREHT